jgi:transposase
MAPTRPSQPLQSLVEARGLGGCLLRPDRVERRGRDHLRRQHAYQGASFGSGRKRGDYANAIGRSRGGRTTKIHALTDEAGRPLALSLTPGQAHDLVGLGDVLSRVPTPERLIADRAYDARKLREWLAARGCEVVIPPNPTRKNPYPWDQTLYRTRTSLRGCSVASKTSEESPPAMTSAPTHSSPPSSSPPPSSGGSIES